MKCKRCLQPLSDTDRTFAGTLCSPCEEVEYDEFRMADDAAEHDEPIQLSLPL